ncbi:MAG: hypothetical protein ACTS3F_02535 [Phycisphaerales bacterium]
MPPVIQNNAGRIAIGLAGGLVLAALIVIASFAVPQRDAIADPPEPAPPTASQLDAALRMAGLIPEVLAAAGANADNTSAILAAGAGAAEAGYDEFSTTHSAIAAKRALIQSLQRTVTAGLATNEQITELATEQSALQSLESEQAVWLAGVRAAAIAAAPDAMESTLSALATVDQAFAAAPAYRLGGFDADEAATLNRLLRAKAAADSAGQAFPSEMQDLLNGFNAGQAVSVAIQNQAANIAAVSAAWAQAIAAGME